MNHSTFTIPSIETRRTALADRFPVWPRETLSTHFEKMCRLYNEREFLVIDNQKASYGEVWEQSLRYAKALLKAGIKRRDHVTILMDNDVDYPALFIAISMVGAVILPVNTMLKKEELRYILTQSDTRLLLVHQTIKKNNYAGMVSELLSDEDFTTNSRLETVVCIPTEKETTFDSGFLLLKDFLAEGASVTDAELEERHNQTFYPDEIAMIMYTSGSTGTPKGVMLSHEMLLRSTYATCLSRAMEDGRIIFAALPFYHCFNIVEGILASSFVGGLLVAPKRYAPQAALADMEKFQANDFMCVPSMLLPLLNQSNIADFDLTRLYAAWCGAAALPAHAWEKANDLLGLQEICTGYGQTEVSSSGVITEMDDPIERIVTRVGRPKLGGVAGIAEFDGSVVQYQTIDMETGEVLPRGEVGELVVRGNTVTRDYYKKPVETAETIDKDGWLRTGDVGRVDEHGYIQLVGRSKEVFKVSGETVAPKEVEDVISLHPAVAQVGLIGVPDSITIEAGAAFVELKQGQTATAAEIQAWCRERIARFKVPRHVWFIENSEWPFTGSGKIQKFKLKEMAERKLAE